MAEVLDQEAIASFCSITGTHPGVAQDYLQVADGHVERAVSLFLDSDGALLGTGMAEGVGGSSEVGTGGVSRNVGTTGAAGAAPLTVRGRRISISSAESGDPHVGNGDDMEDIGIEQADDPDFEFARALQAEEQRDSGSGLRAPIAPHHETLVGSQSEIYEPSFATNPSANASSIFEQRTRRGRTDESPKTQRLAQLFRPPFDLIYNASFEDARAKAKGEGKWLMINPMDSREFACQVMNRDLWSDQAVKTVVNENFVFMQPKVDPLSLVGQKYVNYYPVDNYPHLAIIDPRTAERVKVWNVQLSPTEFLMEVTDFLEANSLHNWSSSRSIAPATDSTHRPPSPALGRWPSSPTRPVTEKAVSDLSEEEQLQAALQASMDSNEATDMLAAAICASAELSAQEIADRHGVKDIVPKENDEPPLLDTNNTRIQIRNSADGSRQVRRFYKSDLVKTIFAFVKASVPSINDAEFDLVFHRESLATKLDQTIAEAGLENASITVEAIV